MIQDIAKTQLALDVLGVSKRIAELQKNAAVYITSGGGFNQGLGDARYVLKAGDTMTGLLENTDALGVHVGSTSDLSGVVEVGIQFGSDVPANYAGLPFRLIWNGVAQTFDFDNGVTNNLMNLRVSDLTAASSTISSTLTLSARTTNQMLYTTTAGLVTSGTGATFDGSKFTLANATSTTNAFRLGSDWDIYRRTTDIASLNTGDSLEIPANLSVGTTIASAYSIYGFQTVADNTTRIGVRGELSITGATTTSFPRGVGANVTISAGTNAVFFASGVLFSTRTAASQTGTVTEMWGSYGDAWQQGTGNIGTLGAGRGFTNIIANTGGTITLAVGHQVVINTNTGTTSNTTTGVMYDAALAHAGSGTFSVMYGLLVSSSFTAGNGLIGTYAGTRIKNPGSNANITNVYGHYIEALSRGTNNYAIGSDAGNKHGFGTLTPSAIVHTAGAITAAAWTTNGINLRVDAATYTDSSSSGTVASMGVNAIGRPTVAASNTTTYTDGATLYLSNSPANGTNVTITNPWTIWVDAGNVRFDEQLRIDKRVVSGVATLTDGATVALDASLGNFFYLTAAGDRTISAPTNAYDGQRIIIAHKASGANRTLTLTTGSSGAFRFGTTITALTVTTSGTTDYIGCIYNSGDSRWDVVAYDKGH
jgi:hypothetical protein